jgi:predicted small metal-binding protein
MVATIFYSISFSPSIHRYIDTSVHDDVNKDNSLRKPWPKTLRCRDVDIDCDFEGHGATAEEILQKAAEHAQTVYGMKEIHQKWQPTYGSQFAMKSGNG